MFGLYPYRPTYWSQSKLADYLLNKAGIIRPGALSADDWDKWTADAIAKSPRLFWIVDELFNKIQNVCYLPYDIYHNLDTYISNRFFDKPYQITTNLKKSEWHDKSELMLHANFTLLVDFIEVEKAWRQALDSEDKTPWYSFSRAIRRYTFRDPELGLKYLDWEMNLEDDMSFQAERAREIYDLYNWWKNIRPVRPDPYEISGWNALYEDDPDKSLSHFLKTCDRAIVRAASDRLHAIEQEYEDEDERNLIRLVKIRQNLWT